jgi:hypothetical protein
MEKLAALITPQVLAGGLGIAITNQLLPVVLTQSLLVRRVQIVRAACLEATAIFALSA